MRITEPASVEKILNAVADPDNVKIMTLVRKESKSAQALSVETGIPQSTVYRKLDELKEAGLVMTEHFTMNAGKKVDYVITTFSELRVIFQDAGASVEIVPTSDTANLRWLGLFRGE